MLLATFLFAFLGVTSAATVHKIEVGEDGFTFDPSTIKADVGDTLEFIFHPQNHSVAQGDFVKPCQPGSNSEQGFYSGFLPVSKGEAGLKFVVAVNTTEPIFFYCPAPGHCRSGMVGVVNPTDEQTFAAYKKAAHDVHSEGVPGSVFGGQLVPNDDDSSSSSSSTSSKTSATSASASSTDSVTSTEVTTTTVPSCAATTSASSTSSGGTSTTAAGSPSSTVSGSVTGTPTNAAPAAFAESFSASCFAVGMFTATAVLVGFLI